MKNLFNLKSFFKFLGRNKLYTTIEIVGLSVSFMFIVLIGVYTYQELSIDRQHKNGDNIYVLGSEAALMSAYGIGERLQDRLPEIERVLTFTTPIPTNGAAELPVFLNDKHISAKVVFTYEDFFDFFDFKLVIGEKDRVLADKNYAVVSESFVKKFFEGTDPIGQSIKLTDSISVIVNGVMKDIKNSSLPECDIMTRMEVLTAVESYINKDNFSNALNSVVFLMTRDGVDLRQKEADVLSYLKEFFWIYKGDVLKTVSFTKLKDVYFSNDKDFKILRSGDWKFVMILMSVGLFILIFAVINYINLTVAQSGFRAKEVAVRSLMGSTKEEMFARLILESILLSFISFIISLILAIIVVPYADALLDTKIDILGMASPLNVLIVVGIIVCSGCMSGFLPALVISRTKAIDVMKGSFRLKTKMTLSKMFIILQNVITIAMVSASLVMVLQINHMINAPLGYNTKNILDVRMPTLDVNTIKTLAAEVERLPIVNRVGYSSAPPISKLVSNNTDEINGNMVGFQMFHLDTTAFNILGLKIIKDNNIPLGTGCFLNQYAINAMSMTSDAVSFPLWGNEIQIAGIIEEFHLGNINNEIKPINLKLSTKDKMNKFNHILVETNGNIYDAYKDIEEVYKRFTPLNFEAKYIDQQIEESFEVQLKTSQIVVIFSFIAIIISLLGLFAMSIYFIEQRRREIALRKVFGSENTLILYKLVRTFLFYVLIAFVITAPFMWYVMGQWLADYSYKIVLSPWIFIVAGVFCLVASFVTVFWQSHKAATKNPIENLRKE